MQPEQHPPLHPGRRPSLSFGLQITLAAACGLIIANVHYPQSVLADMAEGAGLDVSASGVLAALVQLGYCAGILFMVPLGDITEARRLIVAMLSGAVLALLGAALADGSLLLAALFMAGFFSSAMQMIVPVAAGMADERERGGVVGLIMAGAITGIILSRPFSHLVTLRFGWRWVFCLAALFMAFLAAFFAYRLPRREPALRGTRYRFILSSMARFFVSLPGLRLRLLTAGLAFAAFAMFWAAVPIALHDDLGLSHTETALFSLAGLLAPLGVAAAGRLADNGWSVALRTLGIALALAAFLIPPAFGPHLAAFALTAFLLDPGANMARVLVQNSVLSVLPEARSRLNALCVAATFAGGAAGSLAGPWLYESFGWNAVALTGAGLAALALACHQAAARGEEGWWLRDRGRRARLAAEPLPGGCAGAGATTRWESPESD